MSENAKKQTTVTIFRYDPSRDQEPYFEKYDIPYNPNESILGVLEYVRENYDSTLSFRSSCRTGCCVICTFKVNGSNVVTCRSRMQEDMVIEPVNKDKVVKDLVVKG